MTANNQTTRVEVVWNSGPVEGRIEVAHGRLVELRLLQGEGAVDGERFNVASSGPCRLELGLVDSRLAPGGRATRVTLRVGRPFTFFLRDVNAQHPVYLPWHGAAVLPTGDPRAYTDIQAAVQQRGLRSSLDEIAAAPEASFVSAARRVKRLQCQTWLGLGRDMRIFEVAPHFEAGYWGWIQPRLHASPIPSPEKGAELPLRYEFALGRGSGCAVIVRRRLDSGFLPILLGESKDGDIVYRLAAFVSYETDPLDPGSVQGTPALLAYGHAIGNHVNQEPELKARFDPLLEAFQARSEETVLYLQAQAENTGPAPAYAWFAAPRLYPWHTLIEPRYDRAEGFCLCGDDRVYSVVRLEGRPMADFETAVLIQPGDKATFEFAIPHQPLPRSRAARLSEFDFAARRDECRRYWIARFRRAAQIQIPERRIHEMIQAGLRHLDLAAYGQEPDDPVAACVGVYTPIGLESVPIVLFLDSMGLHDLARRAIEFFLEMQREGGFIQLFADYMLETGGVLLMIGEHYRMTRDLAWIRKIAPRARRAIQYLLEWRERNLREELHGRGYGMLEGKVADPNDPQRYFMNNGLAYAGLQRAAEWLAEIDPPAGRQLAGQAESFRQDIRAALLECLARSPVIPRRDGVWCPTAPPWAEGVGPTALYCEGEPTATHHTVTGRDALLGPLWLLFCGVIDPREPVSDFLMHSHAELATIYNVPFSQPYYSRADYAHLRRGEVAAFLKRYYFSLASLADRETYTFWEHFFHVSPHKLTEEAWFLMETRWMLALEDGDTLRLLAGIPRAWLSQGHRLAFHRLVTSFGPVSLQVHSRVSEGLIDAHYACCLGREPARLLLRLPHPENHRAAQAIGGDYDPITETVEILRPNQGAVQLYFHP